MSDEIVNKKESFIKVESILSSHYEEIQGEDFYRYIFPKNQNKGEYSGDYSQPNAIYLYKDPEEKDSQRTLRRRIMLNDSWHQDYENYIKDNPMTLCSGLSYRGRRNRLENAQEMNALIFDLDAVSENEVKMLLNKG